MVAIGSRPLDFSGIEDVSGIVNSAYSGELLTIKELCSMRRTLMAARALSEKLKELSSSGDYRERYRLFVGLMSFLKFCVDY